MHPFANDPNVPAALRRAFAKVKEQIVRHYEDGSEWSYNVNPASQVAADLAAKERSRIGQIVDGRKLVSIEVRAV